MSTRSYAIRDTHPLADKTVTLNESAADTIRGLVVPGAEFIIEDWWVNMEGEEIQLPRVAKNFAEMHYVERMIANDRFKAEFKPTEAVYGKIGWKGHLVHVSELGDVIA